MVPTIFYFAFGGLKCRFTTDVFDYVGMQGSLSGLFVACGGEDFFSRAEVVEQMGYSFRPQPGDKSEGNIFD